MKQLVLTALTLAIITLTACDKTYKCECTATSTATGTLTTPPTNIPAEFKSNDKAAQATCDAFASETTKQATAGTGVTVACKAVVVK
jgi:hypothetical protein